MRRTSYVSAGYLIAEVTAVLLVLVMIFTDLGPLAPTLCLVGLISYLLVYLVTLIRDLDNPFEYLNGVPGAADVSLDVLEQHRGPAPRPPRPPRRRRRGRPRRRGAPRSAPVKSVEEVAQRPSRNRL